MRVKDLFNIVKGRKAPESFEVNGPGRVRYIQIEDLRGDANLKYCTNDNTLISCKSSDVLIAWDGANAGTIGYGLDGKIGSTIAKLVLKAKGIYTPYVGRFLASKAKYLRDNCTGATIPHISRAVLDNIEIPLPPYEEQVHIATVLDKADTLRQKDRELMQRYDELLQAVFVEMFGDPSLNSKMWTRGTIRELVSDVKYGTSAKASSEGKYVCLRMNNITYSGAWDFSDVKYINIKKEEEDKYLVKRGDILFNRTNSKELVGKTAVFKERSPMAYAGYLIRLRTNKTANPEYISAYLNSKHGKAILQHMCKNIVGMANINAQELQDIPILLPPVMLQNEFAKIVDNIEMQKRIHCNTIKKSEELFQSLLNQTFTGRLTSQNTVFNAKQER